MSLRTSVSRASLRPLSSLRRSLHLRAARLLPVFVLGCLGLTDTGHAATYYVSPSGNDANTTTQAQNISTPWKTIQKAASSMAAGDTCLIRAGTYRETVTMPISGTAAAPITFKAYTGEVATISGTNAMSGWTLESTNVYYTSMPTTLGNGNQVFQSGAMKPEARWPNVGSGFPWQNSAIKPSPDWSYVVTSGYTNNANGWFTDTSLPARANGYWNGATVHIMSGHGWIMASPKVTSYTDSSKTMVTNDPNGANAAYAIAAGNEYYLTGVKGEMDSPGEWFYDTTTSRLYFYSTSAPANVEAKQRSYGFDLRGRSYINLVNLDFFACTIESDSGSTNETFNGLSMQFLGHGATNSSIFGLTLYSGTTLRNSELAWDSRGLIQLAGNDIKIINNYFHDSGYVPTWDAMVNGGGNRILVSHNTFRNSGRAEMGNPGRSAIVEYNDMANAMKLTTDGGIFYTFSEAGNTIVRYNLFHDSTGPLGHSGAPVEGFYLDSQNSSWIVHHNIVWNVPGWGMQFNTRQNFDMIFNNTVRNTAVGLLTSFDPGLDGETGTHVYNNLFNTTPEGLSWSKSDMGYNLYTDPKFVAGTSQLQASSPAIDQGTVIPGVTDGYVGSAPDMGALEYGGTDWTTKVGNNFTTPPSPDPTYSMPAMVFPNKVVDGSFESGNLSPNWTTTGSVTLFSVSGHTAWTDGRFRSGAYSLMFGQGTSQVTQHVTGLQPGRRHKLYVGTQTAASSAVITIGIKNYGYAATQVTVPAGSGVWEMNDLWFITGASSTTADIYVSVTSTTTTPVYVDDMSVELSQENTDPIPYTMPVAAYPFDESSGATAYDSTTNGRNATLTNTSFVSGEIGNALDFNGTSSTASASLGGTASPGGSFTVAFWVKFNSTGTGTPPLASNNNNGWLQKGWYICANQGRNVGMYLWDGAGNAASSWTTTSLGTGVWTHMAFSVDRENGVISQYRNGVLQSAGAISSSLGSIDTTIGLALGSPSFDGDLDNFQTWNYALDPKEIASAAGGDPGLAVRCKLNDNAGSTKAWDASGFGHNATLTGMNTSSCWVNGALQFSSAGYVQCPPLSTTSLPSGSFSVAFWVKFADSGTGTPQLVSNNNNGWLQKGWYITGNQGRSVGLYLWDGTGASVGSWTSSTLPVGTWTHLAYTVDRTAGVVSRYRNGVLEGTVSIPSTFGGVDTLFGPRIGSPTLNAMMDDVRVYSRVLSWSEVLDIPFQADEAPYY
ncbi:concanavalin A-like lectin/glucanase superfamily protein [Chthoniobacter flavus]|uniref:LamG-like jellyroll fold domain-containing protein n=1 Tax=Chthoniobacter flavus TaxID=191863 RepID=UPI0010E3B282|nr:LamG-like jellyroll fold domain-containing protein [Chthoniobacter flavus]TCO91350.1 concanavalin A-like lectin/glucanase superfamily protein [Chthoniobacter flavus]